jgi:hypothetical protein
MEISREGLMLGAGTVLAGIAKDERGRLRLALDDESRALALLATAYERPVEDYVLAKMRRAAELWTEGDKALAHTFSLCQTSPLRGGSGLAAIRGGRTYRRRGHARDTDEGARL